MQGIAEQKCNILTLEVSEICERREGNEKKEIKKTHYYQLGQILRIRELHYIGDTDIVMNDKKYMLIIINLTCRRNAFQNNPL